MKSVLKIPLGRQIQVAVAVFVLLPASLLYGPFASVLEKCDLVLREFFTPRAVVTQSNAAILIDAGPTDYATLRALIAQMDDAASVTLVDPLVEPSDTLAEAIRFNGATYIAAGETASGSEPAAIFKAASRGIAHTEVPTTPRDRHSGLRAWKLNGSTMRASAALLPLLQDGRWRERTSLTDLGPGLRVIPMRGLTPDVLNAANVLADRELRLGQRTSRRHVYIGGNDTTQLASLGQFHTALVTGQVLRQPGWSTTANWLAITLGMFLLVSVLWQESRKIILIWAVLLIAIPLVIQWTFANQLNTQLDMFVVIISLLCGLGICFWLTPDRQSNRRENFRSGVRYLRSGKLDAAFRVFKSCPSHPSLMPTLYKLALAFEKRSQPEQARAVFAHMAGRKDAKTNTGTTAVMASDQSPSGPSAVNVPEKLGRYEVLRPLGSGAMGGVFLGRDPRINRLIALKIVSFDEIGDEAARVEARSRFFQEAESAGRLTHPGITAVYDSGEEGGLGFIAMEYAPGVQMIRHTRKEDLLDPVTMLRAMIHVAEALDYAHSEHVVHRDIKPANLIYDAASESIKITDFGVARLVDDERTQTGLILGTPTYMSPEQTTGAQVSGSSDLFSLGVTLYELLTGEVPFRGKSVAELMTAINNKTPQPASAVRPGISPVIDTFLEKALAKQPENRFASGHDMAFAMRECISGMFGLVANQ
ncbi:MAG: serine/threonine-protein kinase [Pseudomonadota bacterium]